MFMVVCQMLSLERIIEEGNIGADLSQLHPAIPSYVYPNSWDKSRKDSLKYTSFTLLASIPKESKFLLSHLEWDPKYVGIADVGLDYTTSCGCKHPHNERQEKYYIWVIIHTQNSFLPVLFPEDKS